MELDSRQLKGLEIASTMRLRKKGSTWRVPSQNGKEESYAVQLTLDGFSCTCADNEIHNEKCKHIHAVEFSSRRETLRDGTPISTNALRPTYAQNWTAYNAAQTNEKARVMELLRGLCDGVESRPQGRGRPRLPLSDAIFCAVMKVYTTRSGRRATSDLRECYELGYVTRTPHYNSIFNYLEDPDLTPILQLMVEESASPLAGLESSFAADSSGFSTSTYERWFDAKYGKIKIQRYWVKCHLMVGVVTNIVTAVRMTGPDANDSPELPDLLHTTAKRFQVEEVSADKGYASKSNMKAIVAAGATPYIPFRANTTGKGSDLWRRLWHFYQFKRGDFLAHYNRRSNVEATFSMIKAKFGPAVRSKTPTAQQNEVLCKVICHNLCCLVHSIYELGIDPTFWKEPESTDTLPQRVN